MKQNNHGCPILNGRLSCRIEKFKDHCGVAYSPGSEPFMVLHALYRDMTTGNVRCSVLNEELHSSMRWDLGFLIRAEEWKDLKTYGFTWRF